MTALTKFLILFFVFTVGITVSMDVIMWIAFNPVSSNYLSLGIAVSGACACALLSLLQPPWIAEKPPRKEAAFC